MGATRRRTAGGDAGFDGFPAEGPDFFRRLAAHNDRAWFLAHKDVYERACRRPLQALAAALAPRWGPGRISRINRDLRFARGRPPYKTYIAVGLAGRYISLSAEGLWAGSGIYRPEPARLARLRAAIDDRRTGPQLQKILASLRARGYEIDTHDRVASAPRGYAPDHPRIDLLRMKDIYAGLAFPPNRSLASPAALERIERVLVETEPLVAWMQRNVPAGEDEGTAAED